MSLRAAGGGNPQRPTPAQLADGEREAKAALDREVERHRDERLGWVAKARQQLNDYEDRFLEEIDDLPKADRHSRIASFNARKASRVGQLGDIEQIQATAVRLVGWANVKAGVSLNQLGYDPNAEKVAVGRVIAELQALGYVVDDRQTAGVGYDLLARHKTSADQRCVEVKGFTHSMGPVWLEQNEWAQALQRREDYWLYVVDDCGEANPAVRVRAQDPATIFGSGVGSIQRFQINLSQLKERATT
jgi:hypothetical protein